jgi:hypothetical protein
MIRTETESVETGRSLPASRRTDNFWKDRLNQPAARNDTLPLAA